MITIFNNEILFRSELTQAAYDQMVSKIDFSELTCTCGKKDCLVKIGNYPRYYKTATRKICMRIQRVLCKHCGKTHAIFVESMVPSSMLLVSTQIKMLKSYYNHSVSGFLEDYVTIDLSNVHYVVRNYENKWKALLETANLSLESEEKDIAFYFLKNHKVQFMQMKVSKK